MDEVRALADQPLAFAKRFADEADLAILEVTKAAVDDAGGTAGGTGSEVVLLEQENATACAGTLPRDRNSIDSAADHNNFETVGQRWTRCSDRHLRLDARKKLPSC